MAVEGYRSWYATEDLPTSSGSDGISSPASIHAWTFAGISRLEQTDTIRSESEARWRGRAGKERRRGVEGESSRVEQCEIGVEIGERRVEKKRGSSVE